MHTIRVTGAERNMPNKEKGQSTYIKSSLRVFLGISWLILNNVKNFQTYGNYLYSGKTIFVQTSVAKWDIDRSKF